MEGGVVSYYCTYLEKTPSLPFPADGDSVASWGVLVPQEPTVPNTFLFSRECVS